jgi:hypothetical protein
MNDSLELVFAGKKAFARNPLQRNPQGNSIWHGASSPSPRLRREVRDVPDAIALLDAGRAGREQRTPR